VIASWQGLTRAAPSSRFTRGTRTGFMAPASEPAPADLILLPQPPASSLRAPEVAARGRVPAAARTGLR